MTDPTPETTPTRDEAVRSLWETQREISHQEADESAIRLINSHFKNDAERARVSIPANPDRDDDLIIRSYIRQQMRLASAPAPASGRVDAVAEAIGTSEFMDPPDGGDVPLAEQVRRMSEAYKQRGKDIVALMAAIDAEKAGCRQERAARMAFLGAAREALNTSGLTREQVIIADNSISEAFRRVREEARHVD